MGVIFFPDKGYAAVSLTVAVLALIPLFLDFERKAGSGRELAIIAAMTALSVAGRVIFSPVPGFKPVTAVVIISGMYLGKEAGFAVGALTAVISNFFFGQGPWTPFQMLIWGLIGLAAGISAGILRKSRLMMLIYGVLSGAAFSLVMDLWTVLWWEGGFSLSRYIATAATSLPFTAVYAASNIAFLLLLAKPAGTKLTRVCRKYGLFDYGI